MQIGCLGVQPGRMIDQDAIRARYNALGPFLNERDRRLFARPVKHALPGAAELPRFRGPPELPAAPVGCAAWRTSGPGQCGAAVGSPQGRTEARDRDPARDLGSFE